MLIACCGRLSYWQWTRHEKKIALIAMMESRMREPITPIAELIAHHQSGSDLSYRRAHVAGTFDFDHEVVLKNRRLDGAPGMFAITPLLIDGTNERILVSRGFIPFLRSEREARKAYQKNPHIEFVGLLKESMHRAFLASKDPEPGLNRPWVDEWLRVDISQMQKQLPYPVLPVYVEIIGAPDSPIATSDIVSSESGREDIFNLAKRLDKQVASGVDESKEYPIPVFDAVTPPDIHYGYVFEWIWIGCSIFVICFVMQLRKKQG